MVSQCGIKANPINVDAIRNMAKPVNKKDVMKLTGMMAALNRFISKLGKKGLPFLKLLRKANKFEWDDETIKALKELKAFLTTPPSRRTQLTKKCYTSTSLQRRKLSALWSAKQDHHRHR